MKFHLTKNHLLTACATAIVLTLGMVGAADAKGGGGGGGGGMGGGMSGSHMGGSGMTNTNGPTAADRDTGKAHASDRHTIDANRKANKDVADKAKGKGKGLLNK